MEMAGPALESLQRRLVERGKDSLLAGVISPRLLALPIEWASRHAGEGEPAPAQVQFEGLAPVEFSLIRASAGLELRLFAVTPVSHLVLFADILFLLEVDYRGDWDSLFQAGGPGEMEPAVHPEDAAGIPHGEAESGSP
jgi:hypothetical protein